MSNENEIEVEAEVPAEVLALRARLVQAELRTEAVRAGIVDLDGVKLLDATGLSLNAAGELEGGPALIAGLRASKPWLFGRSSSSASVAPRATPPKPRLATEMSLEEWRAARAELLRRGRVI